MRTENTQEAATWQNQTRGRKKKKKTEYRAVLRKAETEKKCWILHGKADVCCVFFSVDVATKLILRRKKGKKKPSFLQSGLRATEETE